VHPIITTATAVAVAVAVIAAVVMEVYHMIGWVVIGREIERGRGRGMGAA
jgi:hypothetical protein